MRRFTAAGVLMTVLATGCATAPPRPGRYAASCESWAQQQTGYDPVAETTKGAVVGTLLGGAVGAGGGAALGAASGGSAGRGAATGAVVGGLVGGVAGGAYQYSKSRDEYERAYAACMSAHGHSNGAMAAAPPPPPAPVVVAPPPPPVVVQPQPPIVVAPPPQVVVVSPPPVVVEPRRVHVPPGHYPPPGYCRVWHPGWPPGHQSKPFPCNQPVVIPAGAFILYNGVAYDGDYDWRAHSRRQPGTVPSVIVEMNVRR